MKTYLNSIRKFSGGRGGNPNRGMGRFNNNEERPRRSFRGRNNQSLGNVNLNKLKLINSYQRNNQRQELQGRRKFRGGKRQPLSKDKLDQELEGYWRKSEDTCK